MRWANLSMACRVGAAIEPWGCIAATGAFPWAPVESTYGPAGSVCRSVMLFGTTHRKFENFSASKNVQLIFRLKWENFFTTLTARIGRSSDCF